MPERSAEPADADNAHPAKNDRLEKHRDMLQALEQKGTEHFDRLVLTLSGGAIALSLTLLGTLKDRTQFVWVSVLGVSWLLLGASLTFLLLSVLTSQEAIRREIAECDRDEDAGDATSGGFWGKCVNPLNWLAAGSCVAGIGTLLVFGALNYNATPKEANVAQPIRETIVINDSGGRPITEGQVLPTRPPGAGQVPPARPGSGGKK